MRLVNTRTLKLEEVKGAIPEYAILSHTWEKDEVSLQEFVESGTKTREKKGYSKITAACRQACLSNIDYCWIDTCCIDKTSSAELSEAINSMFNWYKRAKVCFAYLSDFDNDTMESVSGLAKCRWFTRGWCLQELIAPNELQFYDLNWRFVCTKKAIKASLSEITNIDQDVLDDSSCLLSRPIARRMSWASKRKTERVEDIAYSLLGIFDVNMPLLYGEGDKAFLRLQEEIIKKSNDLSIFAWSLESRSRSGAYIDLLAGSPALFGSCFNISSTGDDRTLSTSVFSLTNRGIQFTAPDLAVLNSQTNREGPDYILPLECMNSGANGPNWRYLLLKKIGPGIFIRAQVSGDRVVVSDALERPWTMEKEIYILPKVLPEQYSVIETSHRSSVEIRTARTELSAFSIQGLEPCAAWDSPRSRFLTQGSSSFVGFVKIYPQLAASAMSEFFVVAVSFRGRQAAPCVCLVHPDVWIMYDAPGRTLAWTVTNAIDRQQEVNGACGHNWSELDLIQYKVTATIHTRSSRNVPVHKIMLDWKPHGKGKRKRGSSNTQ